MILTPTELTALRDELPMLDIWGRVTPEERSSLFPVLQAAIDALIRVEETNAFLSTANAVNGADAGQIWQASGRPVSYPDLCVQLEYLVGLGALTHCRRWDQYPGEYTYVLSPKMVAEMKPAVDQVAQTQIVA